ncbi:hypothetical protein ACWD26_29630 [Streptomyces sp. NPDC002787]
MVCIVSGFICQLVGLAVAVAGVYRTKGRYAPHSPGLRAWVAARACGVFERVAGARRIARSLCRLVHWVLHVPAVHGAADVTLPRVVAGMDGAAGAETEHVRVVLAEDASQRQVVNVLLDQVAWLRAEVSRLDGRLSAVQGQGSALESRMGERYRADIAEAKVDGWATEAAGLILVLVGTVLAFVGTV